MQPTKAIIHPVALFEIIKEFEDLNKKKNFKKKIGSILGYHKNSNFFCTSAFRVPFQEKCNKFWFFDQIYMEKIIMMNKKINFKEVVIGWYSLTKNLKSADLEIHEIFFGYCYSPILLHLWVNSKLNGIIFEVFLKKQEEKKGVLFLKNIPVRIGLLDSENIGVYEILKNSKDFRNMEQKTVSKKWNTSLIFFLKFLEKTMKGKNFSKIKQILNLEEYSLHFNSFLVSQKKKKKKILQVERRGYLFFISSFLRLVFSVEKLSYKKNKK